MKKTIIVCILVFLSLLIIVNATPPKLPPIDKEVIERAKELKYTNSLQDERNLKELLKLFQDNVIYGCQSEDCKVFEEVFLSYPNELLINNVFLTADKKYNPFSGTNFDAKLIEKGKIYGVVPYLVDYLRENQQEFIDNPYKLNSYINVLGQSGKKEAAFYFRDLLADSEELNPEVISQVILNLGKLKDNESFNYILSFCKKDLLKVQSDIYSANHQNCLETFTYYQNPEFVGFVINNLDYRRLNLLYGYVFPKFALNKSIYTWYTTYGNSYAIDTNDMIQIWQGWYNTNKQDIIWSENLGLFIEKGTEEEIKTYLSKVDKPKEAAPSRFESVSFLGQIINWFKSLFR